MLQVADEEFVRPVEIPITTGENAVPSVAAKLVKIKMKFRPNMNLPSVGIERVI